MKYTPGPWNIERYKEPYSSNLDNINISADGLIIAKLGSELSEEQTNNAKLIALAPIMYEALEKLAKLGNEPYFGNSLGNCIAIDVLRKVNE